MNNLLDILHTAFIGICIEVSLLTSIDLLGHDPSNVLYIIMFVVSVIITLIFVKRSKIEWGSRS